jgi:site-specific recombinase XerD
MSTALIPVSRIPTPAILDDTLTADDIESVIGYARNAKARNTQLAYASDWRSYCRFAASRGAEPLPCPPGMLCAYIAHCADRGLRASSIGRHVAAIVHHHHAAGYDSPASKPAVKEVMRGIRHTLGTAPRPKTPLTHELIARMITVCSDTKTGGIRDRALIALAFAAALRRSEVVALQVEDLTEVPDGYRLLIRRSKTDQAGEGQEIAIPRGYHLRPVEAVQMWLAHAEISTGYVFRQVNRGGNVQAAPLGDGGYCNMIKKRALQAGLDPVLFSGHSLRAGFLTSAAESGADVLKMSEVSRHKSLDVLRRYVRRSNLFKAHAGSGFL